MSHDGIVIILQEMEFLNGLVEKIIPFNCWG